MVSSRIAQHITAGLQNLINAVEESGRTPTQVMSKRSHCSAAERRRNVIIAFCGRPEQWKDCMGNWVVPNEAGTIVAMAPTQEIARKAGARKLRWRPGNVVVIPLRVEDPDAEDALQQLLAVVS